MTWPQISVPKCQPESHYQADSQVFFVHSKFGFFALEFNMKEEYISYQQTPKKIKNRFELIKN